MLKLKFQSFGHLMWRTDSLERPWCWERLKAGGEGDDRGWDGWMASLTQWTWVWVSSGSWWWTGRPGVLQSIGLQRVGPNWVTDLNWTELPPMGSLPDKPGRKVGAAGLSLSVPCVKWGTRYPLKAVSEHLLCARQASRALRTQQETRDDLAWRSDRWLLVARIPHPPQSGKGSGYWLASVTESGRLGGSMAFFLICNSKGKGVVRVNTR